ncbi:MAG TPA: hypothetical protein VGD66_01285 [Allosphingosinicella sp.]
MKTRMAVARFIEAIVTSAQWSQAMKWRRRQDYAREAAILEHVVDSRPTPLHLAALGAAYFMMGKKEKAAPLFRQAVAAGERAQSDNGKYINAYCRVFLSIFEDVGVLNDRLDEARSIQCSRHFKEWLTLPPGYFQPKSRERKARRQTPDDA